MLTFVCAYSLITKRNNGATLRVLCGALVLDGLTFTAGFLVGAA